MNKARIHFINGESVEVVYSEIKHNPENGAMCFCMRNGRTMNINWNNVLYIER